MIVTGLIAMALLATAAWLVIRHRPAPGAWLDRLRPHWPLLLGVHLLIFTAMLFGTRVVKPADSRSWFSDWYAVGLLHSEWGTEFWIGPFAVAVACVALILLVVTAVSSRWALWRGDIVLFAGLLIGCALLIFQAQWSFEHAEHSVPSNAIRVTVAGATWVTREHQRGTLDWFCVVLLIVGGSVTMKLVLAQSSGPRFSHLAVWVLVVPSLCISTSLLSAYPLAMPILGAMATWQIKRSNGQLRGLRLAALEAILVPLFLFAALVGNAVFWPISCLVTMLISPHQFSFLNTMDNPAIVIPMALFAICAALIAAFFTGRAVWRKIVGQPAAPARAQSDKPRLSRVALFGAMAPPLVLIFVAGLALIGVTFPAGRGIAPADHPYPRSAFFAAIPMLIGPLVTMVAMTIFGIIAIRQIKQSGGKLYGLRLAAVDALLPPMILLLALIGFLLYEPLARPAGFHESSASLSLRILLLTALLVCVFAVRAKWRAIVGRPAARGRAQADAPRLSRIALFGAVGPPLMCILLMGVVLFGWAGLIPTSLALLAGPLAMLIFGIISISKIKHSGGKLYGLRLAALEVIAVPLIVLFHLVGLGVFWAIFGILILIAPHQVSLPDKEPPSMRVVVPLVIIAVFVALVVSFYAGRAAWRRIVGRSAAPSTPKPIPKRSGIYWRISSFPELNHLDPVEKADALSRIPGWTYPLIIFGSFAVAMVVGGIAAAIASVITLARGSRDAGPAWTLSIFSLVGWATWLAAYLWQIRRVRRAMRGEIARAFRGQKPPFCFACGYELRATTGGACPECGSAISTGNAPMSRS
jgi:hypothetical protein